MPKIISDRTFRLLAEAGALLCEDSEQDVNLTDIQTEGQREDASINENSGEEPFSDTDSIADPPYRPSTSHYSDTDESSCEDTDRQKIQMQTHNLLNDETDQPENEETSLKNNDEICHPENDETHHPSNDETRHPENDENRHPENDETHQPENDETSLPKNDEICHPENDETHHPSNDETRHPENDVNRHPENDEIQQPENDETSLPKNDEIFHPENDETHHPSNDDTRGPENDENRHPENDETRRPENLDTQRQEKRLSRKRKRSPASWKRNIQKRLRLEGKEHLSQKGNTVRAKLVRPIECKCHYKCGEVFSMNDRKKIMDDYLTLPDERSRWSFIKSCISKVEPKRRYIRTETTVNKNDHNDDNNPRKKFTYLYSLTFSGQTHRVCKKFFLATLDISGKKVETSMRKAGPSGIVEEDKRGQNPAPNRIAEERKDVVRNHINSIPVIESHYCRSNTQRKYLPSGLSEHRLYLDYLDFCKEYEEEPVTSSYYRHIFVTEFNYGFHRPKKDQCDYCTQFNNKPENDKLAAKAEYDLHQIRKQEARDYKKIDKQRAKEDTSFHAYTMDMEKILLTPHLEVGQLYYKRKLKTYNFTVYNLADKVATNFMWHEANGTKGSSEVATCLWKLLSELDPAVTEVTFYSDTASGQNRNSIVSAMFLRAVRTLTLQTINQKFMESGHSDMECDSVHSTIERRAKKISVFVPEGWYTVVRTAKTQRPPYIVKEMHYKEFLDFKSYSQKLITNKKYKLDDGGNMKWLEAKWLQYRKEDSLCIYYKTQLSQPQFKTLCIRRSTRKDNVPVEVSDLYNDQLQIDKNKHKDLQTLCTTGTIPSTYHEFYMKTLKSSNEDEPEPEDED